MRPIRVFMFQAAVSSAGLDFDVIVVGAGFAGMYAVKRLRDEGAAPSSLWNTLRALSDVCPATADVLQHARVSFCPCAHVLPPSFLQSQSVGSLRASVPPCFDLVFFDAFLVPKRCMGRPLGASGSSGGR